MGHTCHAALCSADVPPRMFACRMHWGRLPTPAQRLIWEFYRPGQEDDKRPSVAYMAVQQLAVSILATQDARRSPRGPALEREAVVALRNALAWAEQAAPEGAEGPTPLLERVKETWRRVVPLDPFSRGIVSQAIAPDPP